MTTPTGGDSYPEYASHFVPRTSRGRLATGLFVVLLLLAEPPIVFVFANRIDPWLLGVPFLFGYLLLVYVALIVVLIQAALRSR
jgi:hypothetical protein